MKHAARVLSILAVLAVVVPAFACARRVEPGDPLAGLSPEQRRLFERGKEAFERTFEPQTGLGPMFNADSCAECHEEPVSGGPGDEIERHVSALKADGSCDPLLEQGGPVMQNQVTEALRAALGIEEEPMPAGATATGRRSSPDLLGFGLLDAVPDEQIVSRADPDDRDGDGISGRPNRFVDGRLGRFGRKAFVPTLRQFNDGAFNIEQGVTNPVAPAEETVAGRPIPDGVDPAPDPEITQEDLDLTDAFVRFLAPPEPRRPAWRTVRGRRVFREVGCATCHAPALRTGDNRVKALAHRTVNAYTDLLLHDMGPELADVCLGLATPSEFRTEPLMGISLSSAFLHDGRAASIEEAIRLHGGEAARSRDRFTGLKEADRKALLQFLGSL